jgi:lactate racemase
VQAKVQAHAEVVVRSSYLSADDLASAHLGHTEDVAETVLRRLHDAGPESRVCVLPEGPQTIPYVAQLGAQGLSTTSQPPWNSCTS